MSLAGATRLGTRAARTGGSRLRTVLRGSDEVTQVAARGGDDAGSALSRYAAPAAAGTALAGTGALAYRQQDVWSDEADADRAQARSDQLDNLPPGLREEALDQWNDEGSNDGGFLEQVRSALGLDSIESTIVMIVAAALIVMFVMNYSAANMPVPGVSSGGSE